MSKFYGRCVGLADSPAFSPEAAILVLQRRSTLSRGEARVAVYDFLGVQRGQLSKQLHVSLETIHTYWKRIYHKTKIRSRTPVRAWVEDILRQEMEGDSTA